MVPEAGFGGGTCLFTRHLCTLQAGEPSRIRVYSVTTQTGFFSTFAGDSNHSLPVVGERKGSEPGRQVPRPFDVSFTMPLFYCVACAATFANLR